MSDNKDIINQQTQKMESVIARCAKDGNGEKPLLLVGGDMSGIQPFLYQIVSKYAAKNLKGRSCYIDILGKAVVRSLIGALSLTDDHIVCETGGSFVLLAPNAPDVSLALEKAIKTIEERIFNSHGTALSISIASVEISIDQARGDSDTLAEKWQELFAKREAKKNSKAASLMLKDGGYRRFFEPIPGTGDKVDAITGEDIIGESAKIDKIGNVTRVNKEIYELGHALRNGTDFKINPAGLGITPVEKDKEHAKILTFEQMCENPEGLERLGILRMDVDNLGAKFQEYARTQSLAAYSALSYELDDFFKNHVKSLCQGKNCYLLYGGGDDLFVVGEWRNVIKLSGRIQKDFKDWAKGRRGDWSLSAGIAIVKAKYPIIEGAKESGEEEERAKSHQCDGIKKNSISFMGTPLNWEKEFPAVEKLKTRLVELLELKQNALPKSFLNRVMMHAAKASIKNHKVKEVSIYWQLSYDIKRAIERANNNDVEELLKRCQEEICTPNGKLGGIDITTDYHPLELWAFACRWAELEYRSNNEQNNK